MQQSHLSKITELSDFPERTMPKDLQRQSAFFVDAFLTRPLLDAMPGVVLILNSNRRIVFANRAFCQIAGWSETESPVGLYIGDVLSCHVALDADAGCGSGESCKTCGALMAMMSGIEGQENVQECTLTRRVNATEQNLTLRVWSAPLEHGSEKFIVLAAMDISHERRRLALERTFFHDILNLVGSIRGFAELMEIDRKIDPLEISRRIQLASQRVIDEIDAQRVLLAVEKGELKIDNYMLSSREVLGDIVELYEGQEVARLRQLKVDQSAVEFSFVSDVTLIRRILGNMVKNALEASPNGDVVTLGVDVRRGQLIFWVHNSAVIPAVYQQRIFQRDFSTKGSGRGLGTYSMKILGNFLSGEVTFISEVNSGTRFFLSLPISSPRSS